MLNLHKIQVTGFTFFRWDNDSNTAVDYVVLLLQYIHEFV